MYVILEMLANVKRASLLAELYLVNRIPEGANLLCNSTGNLSQL